jgi:hypothetical protein
MNKIPIEAALPVLSVFFMSVVPNSSSVIAICFFLRTHLVINSLRFCTWDYNLRRDLQR